MDEQELWVVDGPQDGGKYWIVGRDMRIVAVCGDVGDAARIANDHNRKPALQAELAAERERALMLEVVILEHYTYDYDGRLYCVFCGQSVDIDTHDDECMILALQERRAGG